MNLKEQWAKKEVKFIVLFSLGSLIIIGIFIISIQKPIRALSDISIPAFNANEAATQIQEDPGVQSSINSMNQIIEETLQQPEQ